MFQRKRKTDRCYLYKKQGYFAKDCPKKKAKSAKMISQLMINHPDFDIESIYSEQSQANEHAVFTLEDSAFSCDNDDSLKEPSLPIFGIYQHTNSSDVSLQVNTVSSPGDFDSPQPILLTELLNLHTSKSAY
jgi:hypothetical protein